MRMADAPAAESPGRHEQALELRKEAYTMALYVAICLEAAFAALPEADAQAHSSGSSGASRSGSPSRTGSRSACRRAW